MRRWILPGLVVLTLLVAVGVFVYFSPGERETRQLLDEVKLHTQGWKDEELRDVLVRLQEMIRESHPRLGRFRIVNLDDYDNPAAVPKRKVSLPAGDYSAMECLREIRKGEKLAPLCHPGWVQFVAARSCAVANGDCLKSYVWPGRPPGVDEVK